MLHIMLTGGSTGGHIFPLIAVSDELKARQKNNISVVYFGPKSNLNGAFKERGIKTYTLLSSKWRRYASFLNFLDIFKFGFSLVQAVIVLFFLMPDVVFSKGGPGALAVVIVARFYFIPVIIHESDSVPGLTNKLSGNFATKIALSFEEAIKYFPAKKVALTGNPVRADLFVDIPSKQEAKEKLGFDSSEPLLFIIGGSQGAQKINNFVFDNFGALSGVTQIYHQVGQNNVRDTEMMMSMRTSSEHAVEASRYKYIGFLDGEGMKTAFAAADVILSRAGSESISEIALFNKPAILVPLSNAANNHQRENAYAYERAKGCVVIEEDNFTIHIVLRELQELLRAESTADVRDSRQVFFRKEAASVIAHEIILLGTR